MLECYTFAEPLRHTTFTVFWPSGSRPNWGSHAVTVCAASAESSGRSETVPRDTSELKNRFGASLHRASGAKCPRALVVATEIEASWLRSSSIIRRGGGGQRYLS